MTKAEVNQILGHLKELDTEDLAGLARQTYPEGEFSEITVNELSLGVLLSALKRVSANLREALDADSVLIPRRAYIASAGDVDVIQELQYVLQYARDRQWTHVESRLLSRLIPYVMSIGYWVKGSTGALLSNQSNSEHLLTKTEEQVATLRAAIATLKKEEATLLEQVKTSREELTQITIDADTASEEAAQIKQLLSTARTEQGELSSMKTTWGTHSATAKTAGDALQTRIDELEEQTTTLLKEIEGKQVEITTLHTNSKGAHDWIEGKRADIIKLTGLAADGSLGHSFNQRKMALVGTLGYWKLASVWASIAVVAYVFAVYLLIPVPDNPVLAVITGIGKVLPVLLVYGFVLRQYSRERSFLEEYEFKAAVALVVNAYADQLAPPKLNEADFKDGKALQEYLRAKEDERRKLISDTVAKLFTPPHIHTEKSANVFTAFRPKAATDMIREAKELIKEAKA